MPRLNRSVLRACATVVCVLGLAGVAAAQRPDHAIEVKFSDPVLVPGYVLPAGTYIFETAAGIGSATKITRVDGKFVALFPVQMGNLSLPENRVLLRLGGPDVPAEVLTWSGPDGSSYSFMYREAKRADRLLAAVTHQNKR